MSTIENGKIYQFMELKYDEIQVRDGGYFAEKHDEEVLKETSKHFNLQSEEVKKIYDSYSKVVANKEMMKINKLPIKKRKQVMMNRAADIMRNNRDNPFYENEGPPSEPLPKGQDMLKEEFEDLIQTISKAGWVLPLSMKITDIEKLSDLDKDISSYDTFFLKYFTKGKKRDLIKHINNSEIHEYQKTLFIDCIESINKGKYVLAVISLITILEDILSMFGENPNDIRMIRVARYYMDENRVKGRLIDYLIWLSNYTFINELYKKSEFDKDEPNSINRHWLLHGRSRNEWKEHDCLKICNAIHSLITIKKYEPKSDTTIL